MNFLLHIFECYDEQSLIEEWSTSQGGIEVHGTHWQLLAHGYKNECRKSRHLKAKIFFDRPEATITASNGFDGRNSFSAQVGSALNICNLLGRRAAKEQNE